MKIMSGCKVVVLVIAVAALASVIPAEAGGRAATTSSLPASHVSLQQDAKPDLSGKWDLNVITDGGPIDAKAEFKVASDGTITGSVDSPQYGSSTITSGSVTNNGFTIKFSISSDQGALEVTMSGTFDEKTLKGTGNAGDLAFSFTGSRASGANSFSNLFGN